MAHEDDGDGAAVGRVEREIAQVGREFKLRLARLNENLARAHEETSQAMRRRGRSDGAFLHLVQAIRARAAADRIREDAEGSDDLGHSARHHGGRHQRS
jgi:hypothetical protein